MGFFFLLSFFSLFSCKTEKPSTCRDNHIYIYYPYSFVVIWENERLLFVRIDVGEYRTRALASSHEVDPFVKLPADKQSFLNFTLKRVGFAGIVVFPSTLEKFSSS